MKKLIPALCLLLVTAVLMGTSTFAWFTMNTTVTATGMQVKAQASGGLLISNYNPDGTTEATKFKSGFSASANALTTSVTTLSPVSTIDLQNWYVGVAENVDDYKIKDGTEYTDAASTGYYLYNRFAIKTAGGADDDASDLVISEVKADNSSVSTELNSSLRVAIEIKNNATNETVRKFFAPFKNSTATGNAITWKAVKAKSGEVSAKIGTVDGYATLTSGNTVKIWDKVPALSLVTIYIYYEGEDTECKASNTVNGVDTLSISVSFKSVPQDPTITAVQNGTSLVATPDNIPIGKSATYQWKKCDTQDGSYENIADATSTTYAPSTEEGSSDYNKYFKCIMTIGSTTYASSPVKFVQNP